MIKGAANSLKRKPSKDEPKEVNIVRGEPKARAGSHSCNPPGPEKVLIDLRIRLLQQILLYCCSFYLPIF